MLDEAFEALKTYDWGASRKPLEEIDLAVLTSKSDEAKRKEVELKLVEVLKTDVTRDAKDYICRKLMIVGTTASVQTLASMLGDKNLSHMARYALERNPAPEALQALREALPKLDGSLKVGVIASLGVRRDAESVGALAKLLNDSDTAVARAAALALGDIRNSQAGKSLADAKSVAAEVKPALIDANLFCAEGLLADGKKDEALAMFKAYSSGDYPKHVRVAATKGMLACAGKKD